MRKISTLLNEVNEEKADIYICEVKYEGNAISQVKVKFQKSTLAKTFELPIAFIVALLKTEKLSIKTLIKDGSRWITGDDVILYDKFITTDGNGKETDNLGNLPRF